MHKICLSAILNFQFQLPKQRCTILTFIKANFNTQSLSWFSNFVLLQCSAGSLELYGQNWEDLIGDQPSHGSTQQIWNSLFVIQVISKICNQSIPNYLKLAVISQSTYSRTNTLYSQISFGRTTPHSPQQFQD